MSFSTISADSLVLRPHMLTFKNDMFLWSIFKSLRSTLNGLHLTEAVHIIVFANGPTLLRRIEGSL